MINFTNCVEEFNSYKGSEKKKTLIYEDNRYLVKFPDPVREKNKNISYINNAFSEYVGSNIFKLVGMDVQNTLLGEYEYKGQVKIVCACEDFTDDVNILYEFENLALSVNPDKKVDTELSDILEVLDEASDKFDLEDVKAKFWDMFVIDSLIGNTDRHNGNWGFLLNKNTKEIVFSPIYDCGSCLNPMYDDDSISRVSDTELKNLAMNCFSCLKVNGKRIHYTSYLRDMKNIDCNKAIIRVFNNINIDIINNFIDNIVCMSLSRKEFYKSIINIRYLVLKDVYNKLINNS